MTRRVATVQLRDVALAIATFAGALGLLAVGHLGIASASVRRLDVAGVLLAGLATLPLVVWRSSPQGVFVLTTAASVALNGLGYPPGPPLGPTVALYLLAASRTEARPWTRRTTAVVGTLLVAHAGAAGVGQDTIPGLPLVFGVLVWSVAWFAGDRTRLRRERIGALEERAARAEREVEQERRLATAQERTRIARDLHDAAGHAINVILVQAGAARLLHEQDPARSRAALETIEQVARQTVEEIEHLVRTLREGTAADRPVEAPTGLAALDTLLAQHRLAGLDVRVSTSRVAGPLPATVDQAAYRIIQEALTNAARHGTGSADVELALGSAGLELTVRNPLPNPVDVSAGDGHGLIGMRERVALLGGDIDITADGDLFRVHAQLPVARSPA